MASISPSISPNPTRSINYGPRRQLLRRLTSISTPTGRKFVGESSLSISPEKARKSRRFAVRMMSSTHSDSHSYDVVIVGAGIIGLSIARQLLIGSDLSVAVVDAAVPCSGATGAGSLLVGKTSDELAMLKGKVEQLSKAGLNAKVLSSSELREIEPAIMIGNEGGAAFLPDDCQLDARRSVAYIEKENRKYAPEGRYREYYHQPVTGWLRSGNGKVEAVQTSKNTLFSNKAVVIATGCWTGSLMQNLIRDLGIEITIPVKPRKGHLLVVENFSSFKLNHGLMEVGYVGHQDATLRPTKFDNKAAHSAETLSISMTATMDAQGNLVLGSSRQFVGFSTEIDEYIINQIWERAGEFFPSLRELSLTDLEKRREVRVGLRPYSKDTLSDSPEEYGYGTCEKFYLAVNWSNNPFYFTGTVPGGKPMIGPVPGLSNVFLAAGHEGEGLSMALGTAEMVADMVWGNPGKVDNAPYALHGCC